MTWSRREGGWRAEDPELFDIIDRELERQNTTIQLIASENFTSPAVLAATGSVLTNKYSEGYPGKRYYGGNYVIDQAEDLARERAKTLFGAEHANVQPHAGANANLAVYLGLLEPGDTVQVKRKTAASAQYSSAVGNSVDPVAETPGKPAAPVKRPKER